MLGEALKLKLEYPPLITCMLANVPNTVLNYDRFVGSPKERISTLDICLIINVSQE